MVKHHSEGKWEKGAIVLGASQESGLVNIDLFPEAVTGFMESFTPSSSK